LELLVGDDAYWATRRRPPACVRGHPPEQPSDDGASARASPLGWPPDPSRPIRELGQAGRPRATSWSSRRSGRSTPASSGVTWSSACSGDDDVAENKGAARAQSGCDTGEEIGLACRWDVMNGERGDDEIEAIYRQRIFKPADPHVDAILR